jgi:DHA1 family bicyclomycin/chloramphenicol resistance-like MFS transporter
MALFALMNARLAGRFGARRAIRWLLVIYLVMAGLLLLITCISADPPPMGVFFTAIALMTALNLAIEPNSGALALEPLGNVAGIAASVYGTCFFFIGSSLGAVISHLMVYGVFPLVISFFVIGLAAVLLVLGDRRA